MPTELPPRRTLPPEPSPAGNVLVLVAGILLMIVVSLALLLHPADVTAAPLAPQTLAAQTAGF